MDAEGPVDEVLVALRLAGEKKRISRALARAREHAEALEGAGRHADAARMLGALIVAGAQPGEVGDGLMRCAEAAWGSESWWSNYAELTGLTGEGAGDVRRAWADFSTLLAFQQGNLVFHPGGWGPGEVLEVRPDDLEIEVRFWNGRKDNFPMRAAIDIFDPLPETDLRAMHYRDAAELAKRLKKEHLEILRAVVERHHGTATTIAIRTALMQVGIEGSAWTAWWRKARKLAENSEWFDVSGSPQKAVVKLLLSAKDPVEGLRKQLRQAGTLADLHARVRDLFVNAKVEKEVEAVAMETLEEAAKHDFEPIEDRLAAWLFLMERTGKAPEAMTTLYEGLREAEVPSDPSVAPAFWALVQTLPGARDQERAVGLLREVYGDAWLDEASRHLQHAPPGMVRPLIEALRAAKRDAELTDHYAGLLARPLRAPALLVTLARLLEDGKLDESKFPTAVQRAQALLTLAHHLFQNRRGNTQTARVHTRLVETLAGKDPLLRTLLKDVDVAGMRSLQVQIQRGVDDAIDHVITDIALDLDRHFFAVDEGPFWEGDTIWTTRVGLERRSKELRELREVKIPENQEAIGRAASYGDLSENAEWEAAMEEMRNLTQRAMEIEEELRHADLIENAVLLENTACPGTTVRYRELESGAEREIQILGPWDEQVDGPEVVSYRAPLAAGLLGSQPGEKVTLTLPSGSLDIELLEVGLANIH